MAKKLCKLAKGDLSNDDLKAYVSQVIPVTYICKKCGRVANNEDVLCKTKKVSDLLDEYV